MFVAFFGVSVLAAFLFVPAVALGSVDPGGFVPCEGAECSFCDLVAMVQDIITWIIGIIFLIFAVLLVVAGFQLVTSGGNQSAQTSAKEKFINALIGIIIVLAAWLIVDTLMRAVLPDDTGVIEGWGPWAEVQCFEQTEAAPD
jgi:cytochrome bd-type quinol oxidase subunit 2